MVIHGIVEHGKGLGHRLGFPTANIRSDGEVSAPNGVWAALIQIEGEKAPRPCMVNQGTHPTAPEGKPSIEAHLLDYTGDLYGRRVVLHYRHFLRPECKFPSLDDLTEQLRRDLQNTREYFRSEDSKDRLGLEAQFVCR